MVVISHCWGVCNITLAIVHLEEENSSKLLVFYVLNVHLESLVDFVCRWEDPEALILSVVNLAGLWWGGLVLQCLECSPDWRTHQVSLEARKFICYYIGFVFSLFPDFFIIGSHFVGLFFTHVLFDLYKSRIKIFACTYSES